MKSINQFKTNLSGGLAKTSLMDVEIFPPKTLKDKSHLEISKNLKFKCQSADLPGKTFGVDERKDYVTSSKHVYGVTFSDLNLTFLCSSNMEERRFFDEWMESILGYETDKANKFFRSSYYDQYVSNKIIVNLYTGRKDGEKSCSFTFRNIFPTTLTAQNVSWMNEDILKLTVSFEYEYWSVNYYGNAK